MHTIFSGDEPRWQAELLAWSYVRAGMHEKDWLISVRTDGDETGRLVVEADRQTIEFTTTPFSPHPVTGDRYKPYNKSGGIAEWMKHDKMGSKVLIIEADF